MRCVFLKARMFDHTEIPKGFSWFLKFIVFLKKLISLQLIQKSTHKQHEEDEHWGLSAQLMPAGVDSRLLTHFLLLDNQVSHREVRGGRKDRVTDSKGIGENEERKNVKSGALEAILAEKLSYHSDLVKTLQQVRETERKRERTLRYCFPHCLCFVWAQHFQHCCWSSGINACLCHKCVIVSECWILISDTIHVV